MPLIDYYVPVRYLHLTAVTASLSLFAARGAAVLVRRPWPMTRGVRRVSVAIDTALLGAGITLWVMLGLNPLRDHWLGAKLLLLLAYIVLGSFALKRAHGQAAKAAFYAAALACAGFMVSVALAHDPAGVLRQLASK
jgi:uncharacterized membrane protein SirB2